MPEIANDWFYMKSGSGEVCDPNAKIPNPNCIENKNAVTHLRDNTNALGATMMQYNDAKMLYNRELLFTVNILAGLVLICYYIYKNQSAIPTPAGALTSVGNASSWTSRLAMSPAAALPK